MQSSEFKMWSLDKLDAQQVWGGRPSLFEHVADDSDQAELPDAERKRGGGLRWAAGALDGVMGHHASVEDERLRAKQIAKAIRDLLRSGTPAHLQHLTRVVTRAPVLGVLDDVLSEIVASGDLEPDRFHELASFLVRSAPDRETVKLGISMLGILVGCDERETLLTIGSHEEFTLFSAVALASTVDPPDTPLWQLAQSVHGWGRIHAVERLAETDDPEIKAWLVREGFINEVMDEYLAYTCAEAGDLVGALQADIVDDALLDGAAGIFAALLNGGPAQDIEDYAGAPAAAEAYLRHLVRRPEHRGLRLAHLLVVEQLREFIGHAGDALEDDDTLRELGWTLEIRRRVLDMCARVALRNEWPERVAEGLEAESIERFHQADAAAQLLDIDTWDHHIKRVRASPRNSPSWFRLAQTEDEARFELVLEFARELIPLDEIASGPGEETGLGPEFDAHETLSVIVQGLTDRPGRGVDLVEAALASPVTRVRRSALRVVAAWSEDLALRRSLLEQVAEREPDLELAEDIVKVLDGATELD